MKSIKSSIQLIGNNNKQLEQFNNLLTTALVIDSRLQGILEQFSFTFYMRLNRLQSLLMVERGYEYSIQSQRYCTYDKEYVECILDKATDSKDIIEFGEEAIDLYNDLINAGIPNEDARDYLPLIMPCYNTVTMNGYQLLDFVRLCILNSDIFSNVTNDLLKIFKLNDFITNAIVEKGSICKDIIDKTLDNSFDILYNERKNMIFEKDNLRNGAIGALTCTHEDSLEGINTMIDNRGEAGVNKIIDSVVCKNKHTSVLEHTHYKYATTTTLPAYNQFRRHRIQFVQRESINSLKNRYMELKTFDTTNASTQCEETKEIINTFKPRIDALLVKSQELMKKYMYLGDFTTSFILFGFDVRLLISDNIVNFCHITQKRLCNRAQYAINQLVKEIMFKLIDNVPDLKNILIELGSPDCIRNKKCNELKPCKSNRNVVTLFK